ncbi:MAG: leader peptidase (prepilin peptidase)/N-methyltransferase [Oleiphilaceae bacterium]|jgi:leader peptidase (prepilin peptidase)/N-methyltransferase
MIDDLIYILKNPAVYYTATIYVGLCVGSFLNVVIYRLPKMMVADFEIECKAYLTDEEEQKVEKTFLTLGNRSACPSCETQLKSWHNIPVISYLCLLGKCAYCKKPISARYPTVELMTALVSVLIVYILGFNATGLSVVLLSWLLIAASLIDYDTGLLPSQLIFGALWLGLLVSTQGLFVSAESAIFGAALGYSIMYVFNWLFKALRGYDGIGQGDFILMAAAGAWIGYDLVIGATLVAYLAFIFLELTKRMSMQNQEGIDGEINEVPFAPYIAASLMAFLLYGEEIITFLPLLKI